MYADCTLIKDAIDNGATYSGGFVVEGGVAKKLVLTNGVFTLDENDPAGVLFYNRRHFDLLADGVVLTDPGEYQFAIADAEGNPIGQLAIVAGRAKVIDP